MGVVAAGAAVARAAHRPRSSTRSPQRFMVVGGIRGVEVVEVVIKVAAAAAAAGVVIVDVE